MARGHALLAAGPTPGVAAWDLKNRWLPTAVADCRSRQARL